MNVGHLFCISSFKDFSVDSCPMLGNMQTVLQNTHANVLLINSSARVHAQVFQSCLTLCSPMDCSLPGTSVYGILQARILGRVLYPWFPCDPHNTPMR